MDEHIKHLKKRLARFKKYGYDILKERDFALGKAGFEKGKTILEIGTGRGYMALTLAQKGFKITSVDTDKEIQQSAKAILKHYGVSDLVRLKLMDAGSLGFKDESFDCVIAVNFMHHAKHPIKCLREMARVAKEKILIVDVNKRGEAILERVHAKEGHRHEPSKITFEEMRAFFQGLKMGVKTYRSVCQTVIVAKKGE
jgi:ubiquinone/menaquinone biosynthesis C-methylase UbiE